MLHSDYQFRAAGRDDLPMLRRWLETEAVRRWWGEPEEEIRLIEEDFTEPRMAQWIISHHARAFAYAQAYEVHAWPAPHLEALPDGAKAIDVFIGEPDMIGRGHGAIFLRRLAEHLIEAGAPAVAIDPVADNARARRAYAKAGFEGDEVVETRDGPAVVMLFES